MLRTALQRHALPSATRTGSVLMNIPKARSAPSPALHPAKEHRPEHHRLPGRSVAPAPAPTPDDTGSPRSPRRVRAQVQIPRARRASSDCRASSDLHCHRPARPTGRTAQSAPRHCAASPRKTPRAPSAARPPRLRHEVPERHRRRQLLLPPVRCARISSKIISSVAWSAGQMMKQQQQQPTIASRVDGRDCLAAVAPAVHPTDDCRGSNRSQSCSRTTLRAVKVTRRTIVVRFSTTTCTGSGKPSHVIPVRRMS